MFERFTERSRQVVVCAQDEARRLRHDYIGTEHLLLGLLRVEEGLAARVLESFDVTVEEVRAQVRRIVGEGDEAATTGQIPFTPRAKKALELALREALSLGHNYIGTEHILLGLVREGEGVATRILLDFDADAEKIRNEIMRMLARPRRSREETGLAEIPPELAGEIERIRREKEAALEAHEFERAAALRDRERELVRKARGRHELAFGEEATGASVVYEPRDLRSQLPTVVAIVLAAASFPLGLLVGWLIWGS